ncbi:hypothetical protein CT3_04470 [Comamonas terrigena NBRC 13299]|nr:hypothetical protein CT3_04470 [Comamonas terrigena NBRC 13299]
MELQFRDGTAQRMAGGFELVAVHCAGTREQAVGFRKPFQQIGRGMIEEPFQSMKVAHDDQQGILQFRRNHDRHLNSRFSGR